MIVVDANLLLYAYDATSIHHAAAKRWLEDTFSGPDEVRLPWVVVLAFLRIVTNPRAVSTPLPRAQAATIVSAWLALPNVGVVDPTRRHWDVLSRYLEGAQAGASLVTDAHIAAITAEHGATLATNDRDFTRFEGIRVVFPLAEP